MDKNTITGFVLIALVLIGFNWISRPSQEELAEMARQDSIAAVQKQQAETQAKAIKEKNEPTAHHFSSHKEHPRVKTSS